uniref:Carrier domain-containing protein n=1 Tax=Phaeomonas parva TaxID=124430 RepID=A0A7S1XLC4_9STRA|mmetsp:Transcript_13568/g.40211  ORF Transcript_13568/g.40211 Transcript_13568/m.40211 type:complete len:103 (+) Transcript_13568:68-376(+)
MLRRVALSGARAARARSLSTVPQAAFVPAEKVMERTKDLMFEHYMAVTDTFSAETSLGGLDALHKVDLIAALEKEFAVDLAGASFATVGDIVDAIAANPSAK